MGIGSILWPHHHISPKLSSAFAISFTHYKDGGLISAPRKGFLHLSATTTQSETNSTPLPRTAKKRTKEELIAFFRSIQTSIATSSIKNSKRRKKKAADPFEEINTRKQSYGRPMTEQQYSEVDIDVPSKVTNLDDMKVTELRALARRSGLKGYSKLKKAELIDLLRKSL